MVKKIEEVLADNVRERRKTLRLSQSELASAAKVSLTTINRIEKGRQPPRKANLEQIASVLQCSLDELYGMAKSSDSLKIQLFEHILRMDETELRALWLQLCADIGDQEP